MALSYMFDAERLDAGKYYISVQAIDAGGLGGVWSDECVYEHKQTAPSTAQLLLTSQQQILCSYASTIHVLTQNTHGT